MTRNDMIQTLRLACNVSGAVAAAALDTLFDEMASELQAGGEVPLPGIGKLKRLATQAGQGRNPRTGAPLAIAAGYRVKFTAAKPMKNRLAARAEREATQQAAE